MSFATIDALRENLGGSVPVVTDAYRHKQLHQIPEAPVVKRAEFIVSKVKGKRVLEFGASGRMHELIVQAAESCVGVDRETGEGVFGFDLDDVSKPYLPNSPCDVIICGEVLEHLGNPQWFLSRLKRQFPGVPVVLTVPSAFSASGLKSLLGGVENVNRDHVAYYSYRTLLTLVERVGYAVTEWAWYSGQPRTAEGLIFVVE